MSAIRDIPTAPITTYPREEVELRLRGALQKVAGNAALVRAAWEPLLDSKIVVGTVLVIEDLFPACRIPPDKVVRKGGYFSVDEALDDMLRRIERLVAKHNEKKGHK